MYILRSTVLFSFLIIGVSAEYEASMILFYGKMLKLTPPSMFAQKSENCTENCLNDQECVASTWDTDGFCKNFVYKADSSGYEVEIDDSNKSLMVAIKTNYITCPTQTDYPLTELAYVDRRNNANALFQWTRVANGWTLAKNGCYMPWQIFRRSETMVVCSQVVWRPAQSAQGAAEICQGYFPFPRDYDFKFIGIGSQFELEQLTGSDPEGIWIDGKTDCTSGCTLDDYKFSDGLTTSMTDAQLDTTTFGSNTYCLYASESKIKATVCDRGEQQFKKVLCGFQRPLML